MRVDLRDGRTKQASSCYLTCSGSQKRDKSFVESAIARHAYDGVRPATPLLSSGPFPQGKRNSDQLSSITFD